MSGKRTPPVLQHPTKPRPRVISIHSVRAIFILLFVLAVLGAFIAAFVMIRRIKANANADRVALVDVKRGKFTTLIPRDRVLYFPAPVPKSVVRKTVSNTPIVDLLQNFLTAEDADNVIAIAAGRFKPSTTLTNNANIRSNDRTSSSVFLNSSNDAANQLLIKIKKMAAAAAGVAQTYMEPLQVVKYEQGEYYREHYDYLDADSGEVKEFGQRTLTILVYLNTLEDSQGGGTRFHVLEHTVKPVKGNALLWHNVLAIGQTDPRTLHSGEPILQPGVVKYAMNIWFRNKSQT